MVSRKYLQELVVAIVVTRSGPNIPAVGAIWRGLIFWVGSIGTMANVPYLPDFRPLALPHGLEGAPVVHQLDPGHLGEVGQPHHWLSHGQCALPT